MEDAYHKMRDSFSQMVPSTHLAIARWCITHKQWTFARRELLDALHLDPHREDATRMLAFVERESGRLPQNATRKHSAVTVMPSTSQYSGRMAESYSLGGLKDDTAQQFVRDVQPLISNKCGNAACHGPSRNGFEFKVPRYGSTPTLAEQNLAAVLHFVTPEAPLQSPLLTVGSSQHGPMRVAVFRGRTGAKQLQILRDWVTTVSSELAPSSPRLANYEAEFGSQSGTGVQQAVFQQTERRRANSGVVQASVDSSRTRSGQEMDGESVQLEPRAASLPHGRVINREEVEDQALRDIEYRSRQDPFDPAVFNQRRHRNASRNGSSGK